MPEYSYLNYQKSISDELISTMNRVRDFIGGSHWGEDGRYKEVLLSEMLKNILPDSVSIGTGFVINNDKISRQIDIIVYKTDEPIMFKKNNFVIVPAETVLGIIEVKTTLNSTIKEVVEVAHHNGQLIGKHIFNGIFGYETKLNPNRNTSGMVDNLRAFFISNPGYVNNIAFGKDIFMKYWASGAPTGDYTHEHYSFYKMENLAFGYFISNLVEDVYIQTKQSRIPPTLKNMLYPIYNGKEQHRLNRFEIEI